MMDLADRATTITFLLRDRDSRCTTAFDTVLAAGGIRMLTSPPGAPRANAICERMIENTAPRATRQGPDCQRAPPASDPHDLPSSFHHRASTPHTRATRCGPDRNRTSTSDQPSRLPGSPQTDPRRAHIRVPPHRHDRTTHYKTAGQTQNRIYEPHKTSAMNGTVNFTLIMIYFAKANTRCSGHTSLDGRHSVFALAK
jgi:hypothetical protein